VFAAPLAAWALQLVTARPSRGKSAALEDHMRRIVQVFAVAAALAAFPAFAEGPDSWTDPSGGYVQPGSERDPFSQTYTGRDPEEARAERERELKRASPCDKTCACGHKGAAQEHPKA
jgi:hypothetical protein